MFHSGIRRNNSKIMQCARRAYRSIWYARNHPIYQKIEFCDFLDRQCYPQEIREHVDSSEAPSVSGDPYAGESPDFILETENKNVKKWLPPKPEERHWRKACNNQHKLDQV